MEILIPRPTRRLLAALLMSAAGGALASHGIGATKDLADLPIEQLMDTKVYGASRFPQKISEAPSNVTVVTAAEIRAYGHRTLAEILRSVPGVFTTYDRNYSYAGVRGFGRPGDYNSRILVLVDGNRLNDAVWDSALIGTEFILDVALIERVEFIAGPSIHGSNAFLGVVNIHTLRGESLKGGHAQVEAGSGRAERQRLTLGGRTEGGLDWLVSGSRYASRGRDLYFAEYDAPATNFGIAHDTDYDRYGQLFAKASIGGLQVEAAASTRTKGIPTGFAGAAFNDPGVHSVDKQGILSATYGWSVGASDLVARAFYGSYPYRANFPYQNDGTQAPVVNRDSSLAQWWGAELRVVSEDFARHRIVMGAEYQNNRRQSLRNYDDGPDYVSQYDVRTSGSRLGAYVQDDFTLREGLVLNGGLRLDHDGVIGTLANPRAALIVQPRPSTTLKLLYVAAFRAPNTYEIHFAQPGVQRRSTNLGAEKIRTVEAVIEEQPGRNVRLTGSVFHYRIQGLIDVVADPAGGLPAFENRGRINATGAQFTAERLWDNGCKARASYSFQRVADGDSGAGLTNSPRHLAKVNFSTPELAFGIRAGAEAQYLSARETTLGRTAGHTLVNLTLRGPVLAKDLELTASLYNLLDRRYADPMAMELARNGVDTFRQDGRTWRVSLEYGF